MDPGLRGRSSDARAWWLPNCWSREIVIVIPSPSPYRDERLQVTGVAVLVRVNLGLDRQGG